MKRYRLLKDLPYVKAGAVFVCETIRATEIMALESPDDERPGLIVNKIIDFDEWFEEVKKSKRKYLIDFYQAKVNETLEEFYMDWADNNLTDLMVWFDTREEAEKHPEEWKTYLTYE